MFCFCSGTTPTGAQGCLNSHSWWCLGQHMGCRRLSPRKPLTHYAITPARIPSFLTVMPVSGILPVPRFDNVPAAYKAVLQSKCSPRVYRGHRGEKRRITTSNLYLSHETAPVQGGGLAGKIPPPTAQYRLCLLLGNSVPKTLRSFSYC